MADRSLRILTDTGGRMVAFSRSVTSTGCDYTERRKASSMSYEDKKTSIQIPRMGHRVQSTSGDTLNGRTARRTVRSTADTAHPHGIWHCRNESRSSTDGRISARKGHGQSVRFEQCAWYMSCTAACNYARKAKGPGIGGCICTRRY